MNLYILTFLLQNLILAIVLSKTCSASKNKNETDLWNSYKIKNAKIYKTKEDEMRKKKNWSEKKKLIDEHNLRASMGFETYTLKENSFIDYVNRNKIN